MGKKGGGRGGGGGAGMYQRGVGWVGLGEGLTWLPTHGPRCLPCRTRLGGCTRVSGHKAYRTVDRPQIPWWRSRAGDAAVPVCMCPGVSGGGGQGCIRGGGRRGSEEGHKATDTELTYAPVSQAYGHRHKPQFIVWLATLQQAPDQGRRLP